jgi:5-methylcytosine-specific restriction endonuclease McrA
METWAKRHPARAAELQRRQRARNRGEDVPLLKRGPKKGYKQTPEHSAKLVRLGPDNPSWKGDAVSDQGGRGRAEKLFPIRACERCGKDSGRRHRHHRDGNMRNNLASNIEIICPRCHILEHDGIARLQRARAAKGPEWAREVSRLVNEAKRKKEDVL